MSLIHERRNVATGKMVEVGLTKMAEEMIESLKQNVQKFEVEGFNSEELSYCVYNSSSEWNEVNLLNRTCACEVWQISGIPCVHAVCCIDPLRLPWKHFCHPLVSVEAFKKCYSWYIRLIKCEKEWEKPVVLLAPPDLYKNPGRPRVKRRKGFEEKQSTKRAKPNKCSLCRSIDHNKRGCYLSRAKTSKRKAKSVERRTPLSTMENNSTSRDFGSQHTTQSNVANYS